MFAQGSRVTPGSFIRSGICCCALFALSATAQQPGKGQDHEHGAEFEQHGVHEHGKVTFNVAVEGQRLVVELDAPADNVIGFEHAPRTQSEQARARDQAAWLQAGKGLVTFPAEAQCRFQGASLQVPQWKTGDVHADYEVRLTYECSQPGQLSWLRLNLLDGLHDVREARVNLVTPSRQASEVVRSADTRVKLR